MPPASSTASTRHGSTTAADHQTARHRQLPFHTGGGHDLEGGANSSVGDPPGGVRSVGRRRHRQSETNSHQPLPRTGHVIVFGAAVNLVHDEDGGPQVAGQLAVEPAGGLGDLELADHVVEAGEVDGVAGLAGRDGQRRREVGLADSWWSQERDVGVPLDELQAGDVADLARLEVGLEGEVELLQGLVVRQPGQFEGVAEPASFADPELFTEQQVDEVEVAIWSASARATSSLIVSVRWVMPSLRACSRMRVVVRVLIEGPQR